MNKLLEKYIGIIIEAEEVHLSNWSWDKPFGNHLFGTARHKPETDTSDEAQIYNAVVDWNISSEKSPNTHEYFMELEQLLKDGKYEDVLRPENGTVYRGTSWNIGNVERKYGKDVVDRIKAGEIINVGKIIYSPRGKQLSSWTYNKTLPFYFGWSAAVEGENVSAIMMAKIPNSGNFILNWKEVPILATSGDEEEVIAIGNIDCELMFFPSKWMIAGVDNEGYVNAMMSRVEGELP